MPSEKELAILTVMRQVPYGKVATYGQIAAIAGYPKNSRLVGSILRSLPPGSEVPWHRIVSSTGKIANRGDSDSEKHQFKLLFDEGIRFDFHGAVKLDVYRWDM